MSNESQAITPSETISKFDDILYETFEKLDKGNILGKKLTLNLSTIASLLLLVDKETEIQEDKDGTVERFTRKTLLNDLTEIGLLVDDVLMASVQALVDFKYILVDAKDGYHPDIAAQEIVINLNRMFPGMPGMNLVAYIIQTIDEVQSDRKGFDEALNQFEKTLLSRGEELTFVHLRTEKKKKKETEKERKRRIQEREESRRVSEELKSVFTKKLQELRKTILPKKMEPGIVSKRAISADEVRIKEISPQKLNISA